MSRQPTSVIYRLLIVVFFASAALGRAENHVTCDTPASPQSAPTEYFVSLADAATHIAHVTIRLPQFNGSARLNMPVWNALYQVRNFAAHIENVRAQDASGHPDIVRQTSTSAWDIAGTAGCVAVDYDIYLDTEGPFGSQLTSNYAFFNWAMVLMYSPQLRSSPISIQLLDVPSSWALRDTHVFGAAPAGKVTELIGLADNYDALVDSPSQLGTLQQYAFEQDGATYHIAVHANPADYDNVGLQTTLQRITHATVDWIQDRPYETYTFLYDFPRGPGSGGMEHAYGTAISVSAGSGKVVLDSLARVSAHEFFHLWNVKRIRPQSLEPVDYQHQQDTRALWFSEGVTSTVSELMLARAGLLDEPQYLKHLAGQIDRLESRPAHYWQSAEESSLEAWFEGNEFYREPARSISYYNKGEILGVLLDLRLRQLTHGGKSLRDLFQWMNEHYARQHRYFPDSAGVEEAAESVSGQNFTEFFQDYVAGVKPISYDEFFRFVGLRLALQNVIIADAGFATVTGLDGLPVVTAVVPGSDAVAAGLLVGDRVLEIDGRPAPAQLEHELAARLPNQALKLKVARAGRQHTLKFKVGSRQQQESVLVDISGVTPEQRAHRAAWIHGDDESGGAH